MGLIDIIKDSVFPLPQVEISGSRLYEHLKNIGIDAEIIPDIGIESLLKHGMPEYSFSIRLQGLNIDVIQIKRYNIFVPYCYMGYIGYRTDYIVRGFGRDKWHLEKKLKKLGDSTWVKTLCMFGKKVNAVSPDKMNQCIRIYTYLPLLNGGEIMIEEHGKRVKHVFVKDAELPSKETIEAYNKIALSVRRIIEGGYSL